MPARGSIHSGRGTNGWWSVAIAAAGFRWACRGRRAGFRPVASIAFRRLFGPASRRLPLSAYHFRLAASADAARSANAPATTATAGSSSTIGGAAQVLSELRSMRREEVLNVGDSQVQPDRRDVGAGRLAVQRRHSHTSGLGRARSLPLGTGVEHHGAVNGLHLAPFRGAPLRNRLLHVTARCSRHAGAAFIRGSLRRARRASASCYGLAVAVAAKTV